MITSTIGRLFLQAYNEEYGTNYDARTFFIEQFYPLFFGQNKQMMYVINSPFVQHLPSCRDCIIGKNNCESKEKRQERLGLFLAKVDQGEADASIAIAYPSLNEIATTSGQVSDIKIKITKEDVFYSWIGGALGVSVSGGLMILFNNKMILLDIYKGWKMYRQALEETIKLDGNKINSWNGQWLTHYYDVREFNAKYPMSNFNPYKSDNAGIIGIETQTWTKVLIGIAKRYKEEKVMGYVCTINKVNTTIGFIPFDLTQIRRPIQFYQKYFGMDDGRMAESLWGTAFGFKAACMNGAIGIKAMEPKGLREYIYAKGDKAPKLPKTPKNEEQTISFNVYKIWILAMLNNEELWDKSQRLAELLNEASVDKDKSHSTKRKNMVENVLEAINKKQFVAAMTEVIAFVTSKEEMKGIVKDIHEMPNDNVPYFLTLLRFQYQSL